MNTHSVLTAGALAFLLASTASADMPPLDLDEAQFVQGLRDRGMTKLLAYHLASSPTDDPLEARARQIEAAKLTVDNTSAPADERAAAVDTVIEEYRALIEAAPARHHQLPLWRTQFAEFILRVALPLRHVNAGKFVEFGLPSREARRAFDELAVEAYQQMEQAYLDAFELQGDLPRRDNFQSEYVNTGFWRTFNDEYLDRRIPFTYGWAAYYGTLAEEPVGSLDEAIDQLERVDVDALGVDAAAQWHSLVGRVLVRAEQFGEAQQHLDQVHELAESSPVAGDRLWARLAWVQALVAADRQDAAVEQVQAILNDFREADAASWPLVVLVYDSWYHATDDYQVYEQLFEDPLVAEAREQVRNFVVARLAADPKTPEELAEEAPLVVLAHADTMIDRAVELREAGDRNASILQFENAQQALNELIERSGIDDRSEARARFRLGTLEYRRDRPADAVRAWVELGKALPDEEEAVDATVNAFSLAHSLYRQRPENTNMVELFDDASQTLIEQQEDHPLAQEHTYTRAAFLRTQQRYEEAINTYYDVPSEHPYYPDAMYEIAVIHHTRWLNAEADERAQHGRLALEAIEAALTVFDRLEQIDRESLRKKAGDTRLLKAELLLRQLNEADRAAEALEGFADAFGEFDDLQQRYQRLQVNIAVSQGRFEEARQRVQAFAEQGLGEGGSLIQHALDSVSRRAEDLRERGEDDEARTLDQLGVDLAHDLVDWANQQPRYRDDPRRRLPLELILARQQRSAGELDASRELLEELYAQQYGTNDEGEPVTGADQLEVLYELSVTAMAQEDYDRARPLINRILRLHPSQDGRTWWHSWLMSLQILDAEHDRLVDAGEQEEAEQISARIFRYITRLRHNDNNLGGMPWQRRFEELTRRHGP